MQQAKQLAAEGSYDNLPRAPGSDKEHIDWLQKQITELHETYKILYQRNVSLSNDLAHATEIIECVHDTRLNAAGRRARQLLQEWKASMRVSLT